MKNFHKNNPDYERDRRLVKEFNLTSSDYASLLRKQSGLCAICHQPDPRQIRLAVDHDHATGKVRGLLCYPCNLGLGCFHDNPEFLKKAISYLIVQS